MTNKYPLFFTSTENNLNLELLKKHIKKGTDVGVSHIAFSWVPDVAQIFLDLDNDQLAKTLSDLDIVSYKNTLFPSQPSQISLLIYPLLNKIKTFTFEQQSMLFNTEDFCKHGGVWWTGRISTLLDPNNPFNQSEIGIIHMLHVLECKQKALESRHEKKAIVAVNNLRIALASAFDEYWQKANSLKSQQVSEQTLNELLTNFKSQWEIAINTAKPELSRYRGWGNILLNILANVGSLGALLAYTSYQSGGKKVLYPLLTSDSENILKTLETCCTRFSAEVLAAGSPENHILYPDLSPC